MNESGAIACFLSRVGRKSCNDIAQKNVRNTSKSRLNSETFLNLYKFRNVSEFKRDLDVFLTFFCAMSLHDFLPTLERKQAIAPDSFMLTFDDGLKECYEVVAPILKLKGIPATFFLCSAFVDNKELAYDHKKSLLSDVLRSRRLSSVQDSQVRAVLERVDIVEPSLVSALVSV